MSMRVLSCPCQTVHFKTALSLEISFGHTIFGACGAEMLKTQMKPVLTPEELHHLGKFQPENKQNSKNDLTDVF